MFKSFSWIALTLAGAAAVGPATAADTDWSRAKTVDVTLSSFKFAPSDLHLKAGQPVILHLTNSGKGGHDFSATPFFAAATIRPGDRDKIKGGSVNVGSHASVDIGLVPAAGSYKLKCTHTFHAMFGMTGSISVD